MEIMTKVKQKLCTHNWINVESLTAKEAVKEFINKKDFPYSDNDVLACVPQFSSQVLHDKVCLKCKAVSPKLSHFRRRLRNLTWAELDKAKDRVRKIFISSAKRAANQRKAQFEARLILKDYIEKNF